MLFCISCVLNIMYMSITPAILCSYKLFSFSQINTKLHAVQDELHEITRKLELLSIPGYVHPPDYPPVSIYQRALSHRMEELKEEFVELITELRKRKTVAGGIVIDMEVSKLMIFFLLEANLWLLIFKERHSISSL